MNALEVKNAEPKQIFLEEHATTVDPSSVLKKDKLYF